MVRQVLSDESHINNLFSSVSSLAMFNPMVGVYFEKIVGEYVGLNNFFDCSKNVVFPALSKPTSNTLASFFSTM